MCFVQTGLVDSTIDSKTKTDQKNNLRTCNGPGAISSIHCTLKKKKNYSLSLSFLKAFTVLIYPLKATRWFNSNAIHKLLIEMGRYID